MISGEAQEGFCPPHASCTAAHLPFGAAHDAPPFVRAGSFDSGVVWDGELLDAGPSAALCGLRVAGS
jgi:hypothetical protein